MFSFDWIVLKKIKVKDNKNIVSVFSKEFWKISIWHTESKNKISVDIWNIYNFTSKTENWINKVDSYKAKNILDTSELWFQEINNILKINYYLEKILPNWMVLESIFLDYNEIIKLLNSIENNEKASTFFIMKLLKTLWIAKEPDRRNSWINLIKIFSVVDIYNFQTLMKIEWLCKNDYIEMMNFNDMTLTYYIN